MKQLRQLSNVWLFLVGFTVFLTFFPTLRVLLIGKENANGFFEYLIASIPDLLILFLFAFLVFQNRKKVSQVKYSRLDFWLLFILMGNLIIGIFLSGDPKLIILGMRLTYIPILFYFIARLIYSDEFFSQLKIFLKIIMFWFTCVAVLGLIFYYFLTDLEFRLNWMVGGMEGEYFIKRMNSIFYSPTVNGMFCCMASIYYLIRNFEKLNYWNLFFLSINFWSLLLTVSRGGIIAFFLILLIAIIINRQWKNIAITFSSLAVVFFLCLFSVGLTLTNFTWVFSSTAETIGLEENVSRVELWKRTFEDLKEKPFGYGLGKSGWIAYRFLKGTNEKSAYLATDGWYLKVANETGVFGLLSFLSIIAFMIYRFFKENEWSGDLVFLFYILLSVALINLVSNVFDYFLFNALFWFLVGSAENNITRKCSVCAN